MYVTEDTTRADPETLRRLYSTAIRAGASRVCIADTVGHATPAGAAAVVRFVAQVVAECGGGVGIDWHGHRDRDFAVINSLAALEAGATRLHGAAHRHRRARRQHADGHAARQPGADGLHRARPLAARRVLRDRVGCDRRADPAELPGGRPRRVPDGDRRARRGGDQGVPEEGPARSSTPSIPACRRAWSAASRRSRSARCRGSRTWCSGSRSAACRRPTTIVERDLRQGQGLDGGADERSERSASWSSCAVSVAEL